MISLEDQKEYDIPHSAYPGNFSLLGDEPSADEIKIFVDENVLISIDKYLSGNTNIELGGVLTGEVFKDENDMHFIHVKGHINAEYSTSSLSRLTFTHESWDFINSELEKNFPVQKILGWFHSHPGHTVFFSNHDLFIHENFFNLPFMTAYVYDPTINERGFFFWKEGKIVKAKGYYLSGENKFSDEMFTASGTNDIVLKSSGKNQLYFSIGLGLLNLLLIIILLYNFLTLDDKYIERDKYEKDVTSLSNENKDLRERLNKIITEAENSYGAFEDRNIIYTVKEGEDLKKISKSFYGTEDRTDILIKENNLKSDSVSTGQVLKIPKLSE